jgi:predicted transcriptional regulator
MGTGNFMLKASLGDQELELLRYISRSGPVRVGQAVEEYGGPRDLTRSTINTTVERLYKKGYLSRTAEDDVYRYSATVTPEEVMDGLVDQFVEKTLAGSLTPFVSYFSKRIRLSADEQAELNRFVARLESKEKESDR